MGSSLTSPATLQAGDNITLECDAGVQGTIQYQWSSTLDDVDGSPAQLNEQMLTGFFLHGANTGTHTCMATAGGFPGQGSFDIIVEGE